MSRCSDDSDESNRPGSIHYNPSPVFGINLRYNENRLHLLLYANQIAPDTYIYNPSPVFGNNL